jgi:hypothetical protein
LPAEVVLRANPTSKESDVLQLISVLGALAILGAYVASQFGLVDTTKLSYQVANFLGSAVLTVVAVIAWQPGFILLEGAWALMSLWGIATILRAGSAAPSAQ